MATTCFGQLFVAARRRRQPTKEWHGWCITIEHGERERGMAAWLAPTRGDKYGVVAHVGSGELEHDVEHLADGRSATWSARRVSVGW
jgi:hypothetical protein